MCKHRIQEWIKHNAGSKDNPAPKQDALFLAEKQQLMIALTSTTSKKEFERTLQKATSSKASNKASTDDESSNEDKYY